MVEGERLAVRAALTVGHAGVRRYCDQVVLRKLGDRAVERLLARVDAGMDLKLALR